MSIQRIQAGPRMSQAVVHGDTVYVAGQVGEGATVAEQTASALQSVDDLLTEVGSHRSKILSATIILADIASFDEMNSVWEDWIDAANPPSRATVEAGLAAPSYLVELVIVAGM